MLFSHVDAAAPVVVDLIGDLDATLGTLLTETLRDLNANGTRAVWLSTKYLATISHDGIAALGVSLDAARARGLVISLDGRTQTVREAFDAASIVYTSDFVTPPERARHYMYAHHEVAKRPRAKTARRS